jgi:hypothetical protein
MTPYRTLVSLGHLIPRRRSGGGAALDAADVDVADVASSSQNLKRSGRLILIL